QRILDLVRVSTSAVHRNEFSNERIVIEDSRKERVKFVTTDVIDRLFRRPVFIHRPRKKLIEVVSNEITTRRCIARPRLREKFEALIELLRSCSLVGIIERAEG